MRGVYLQFNTTITVWLTLGPPFDSSTTPAAAAAAALPGHVISIQSVRCNTHALQRTNRKLSRV